MIFAVALRPPKGAHERTEVYDCKDMVEAREMAKGKRPTWTVAQVTPKQ